MAEFDALEVYLWGERIGVVAWIEEYGLPRAQIEAIGRAFRRL